MTDAQLMGIAELIACACVGIGAAAVVSLVGVVKNPWDKIIQARARDAELARSILENQHIAAHPDQLLYRWAQQVVENERKAVAKTVGK